MRFLQLYAHNCHNLSREKTFFSDHGVFGDLYSQAEGFYDSLIERMIGIGEELDLVQVQMDAVNFLKEVGQTEGNDRSFEIILGLLLEVTKEIETLIKSGELSQGTQNLLADMADKTEVNIYKLKQRLK